MGISISEQAVSFVMSALLGMVMGVCYDMLRPIRHAFSKGWLTAVLDVIFAFLYFFAMFCFGMSRAESRVRGYMFLGSALGAGEYFLVFSPGVRRLLAVLTALAVKTGSIAIAPLELWITFLKKFSKSAKNLFKFFIKWYKMKIVFIRPPKKRVIDRETDR